jgi:dethiobiotin synthetase
MDEMTELSDWIQRLAQGPGAFMTGTDTDVGKTWVGVQLLQRLQAAGVQVTPRKPVESGWPQPPATIESTDACKLLQACTDSQQTPDQVCPNRFREPLSPPRAAQLEGVQLTIQDLATQCRQHLPENSFLYVEGAGGFYSPLAHDGLNADLAAVLHLPVILVSEDRVGCINHILLTVEAMQTRRLSIAGVILNPIPGRNPPQSMDNRADLKELLDIPVLRWSA